MVYDRSDLIHRAIDTLRHTLLEEAIVVSLVIFVFLLHLRSTLVPVLSLPVAVALAFVPMYLLGINSNIMSLGGIAIAIGAMVDAAIVLVENAHKHLETAPPGADRQRVLIEAAQGGRPADLLLAADHHRGVPADLRAQRPGRAAVQAARLHQDVRDGVRGAGLDHARAGAA